MSGDVRFCIVEVLGRRDRRRFGVGKTVRVYVYMVVGFSHSLTGGRAPGSNMGTLQSVPAPRGRCRPLE